MTGFMTLEEVDRRAKDLGLSYGQYVARYRSDEVIKPPEEQNLSLYISKRRNKRRGLFSRAQPREKMRETASDVIKKYASGYSLRSIAQDLDISEFELAKFLDKAGLSRRKCARELKDKAKAELVDSGVVPCSICSNTRCDDRKMCRVYRKWVSAKWNEAVAPFRALKEHKV